MFLALKYSPFLQDGATISNGVYLTKALKWQKLGKAVKQVNRAIYTRKNKTRLK